jgi:sugar/nucleoside kinase (ribokinase family)
MTPGSPEGDPLDLVLVGGLTIDRFPDDRLAPGGSVLHATRAVAAAGLTTAVITVAGSEPTAREGIAELRARATTVELQDADETIQFRHRETASGRRLWLECPGRPIGLDPVVVARLRTRALLFAPVASEVGSAVLESALEEWPSDSWTHGAILQGWLRRASRGDEVEPLAPDALPDDLVAAVSRFHALVASREDLVAAEERPAQQLGALRQRFGPGPLLVVTDGPEGVWLDDGGRVPRHLAVPRRVEGVPMVGAGDAFAALFVAGLGHLHAPSQEQVDGLARDAMLGVVEMLDARRPA